MKLRLSILLSIMASCCFGANVWIGVTNNGVGDTNTLTITPYPTPWVDSEGYAHSPGWPFMAYPTNPPGYCIISNMSPGFWTVTSRTLTPNDYHPGSSFGAGEPGGFQGIRFFVDNTTNTYSAFSAGHLLNGANVYNFYPGIQTIIGTNGFIVTQVSPGIVMIDGSQFTATVSFGQVTNALGGQPWTSFQLSSVVPTNGVTTIAPPVLFWDTNYDAGGTAYTVGSNLTNLCNALGLSLTNLIFKVGSNDTNYANQVGSNLTNLENLVSQALTNYAAALAAANTNYANQVGANDTNNAGLVQAYASGVNASLSTAIANTNQIRANRETWIQAQIGMYTNAIVVSGGTGTYATCNGTDYWDSASPSYTNAGSALSPSGIFSISGVNVAGAIGGYPVGSAFTNIAGSGTLPTTAFFQLTIAAGNNVTISTSLGTTTISSVGGAGSGGSLGIGTNTTTVMNAGDYIFIGTNYDSLGTALAFWQAGSNFSLTIGQNGTNFVYLIGQNDTNFALAIGQNDTNYARVIGNNGTNFTFQIAQQGTNEALLIGQGGTNFALTIGANCTNYALAVANQVGANGTNFTLIIGGQGTNYANAVGQNGTNFSLVIGQNVTNAIAAGTNAAIGATISTNNIIRADNHFAYSITNNASGNVTFNGQVIFGASGYISALGAGIGDVTHNSGGYGSALVSLGNADGIMWTNSLAGLSYSGNGSGLTGVNASQWQGQTTNSVAASTNGWIYMATITNSMVTNSTFSGNGAGLTSVSSATFQGQPTNAFVASLSGNATNLTVVSTVSFSASPTMTQTNSMIYLYSGNWGNGFYQQVNTTTWTNVWPPNESMFGGFISGGTFFINSNGVSCYSIASSSMTGQMTTVSAPNPAPISVYAVAMRGVFFLDAPYSPSSYSIATNAADQWALLESSVVSNSIAAILNNVVTNTEASVTLTNINGGTNAINFGGTGGNAPTLWIGQGGNGNGLGIGGSGATVNIAQGGFGANVDGTGGNVNIGLGGTGGFLSNGANGTTTVGNLNILGTLSGSQIRAGVATNLASIPATGTIYVETGGSDINSGRDALHPVLTLTNAVARAESDGINNIKVGLGQFWVSNTLLTLPVGLNLEGSGQGNYIMPYSTLAHNGITPFVDSITNSTAIYIDPNSDIQLSDNDILGNCFFVQPLPGVFPLGTVGSQSYGASTNQTLTTTNCTIHDVTFFSDFIHAWVFDSTNTMQIRAQNCRIDGGGNTCDDIWFGEGENGSFTGVNPADILDLQGVYLGIVGSRTSASGRALLTLSESATVNIRGGGIICTNIITGASQPYAVLMDSSNITLNLSGTTIQPLTSGIYTTTGMSNNVINVWGDCVGQNRIFALNSSVNYPDFNFSITNLSLAGMPSLDGTSTNANFLSNVTIEPGASPLDIPIVLTTTASTFPAATNILTITNSIATPSQIDYVAQFTMYPGAGIAFHANGQIPSCSNWVNSAGISCVTLWTPSGGSWTGSSIYGIQLIGQMRYQQ